MHILYHTHTHTLSLSNSLTHSLTHSQTNTHTHTHTHTRTHTQTHETTRSIRASTHAMHITSDNVTLRNIKCIRHTHTQVPSNPTIVETHGHRGITRKHDASRASSPRYQPFQPQTAYDELRHWRQQERDASGRTVMAK
jgi:hypothetical protein